MRAASMSSAESVVVCGRGFASADLATIREIIESRPPLNRREIAVRACELLRWTRPDGRLKEMSCRVALIRLEKLGLIKLPAPLRTNANGKPYCASTTLAPPLLSIPPEVGSMDELSIRPVHGPKDSRLWNEAVSRFHYLGYKPLPGAQLRYLVDCSISLLGVLGFGASAWKVAPRDEWIGWTPEQRERRLYLIVNNARFLILPWVRVHNLASWILGHCARRLPSDWEERYGYRPVLLETFVDRTRFRGTCYEAANWRYVGDTQGRGKLDRHHRSAIAVKKVYLRPLV